MRNYALIGFGGLGKLHFKNLLQIERERGDIRLTAICGADRETLAHSSSINIGNTSLDGVDFLKYHLYDTVEELFAHEQPDFVISALPTVMHKEVAVYALEHGAHVFSEKPMALTFSDCIRMVGAARENQKVLMIGQCLRFSGLYRKAKEYIDSGEYGRVLRAEFTRYSCLPGWTTNNWILDPAQSGGCPLDMHVHDVDLINYFFGMPKAVVSYSTHNKAEAESIFTTYTYDDLFVSAAADWSFPQKFPFDARLLLSFERAALEIKGDKLTVYTDTEVTEPEVDGEDHFLEEIREFIRCVTEGRESEISSCESVMNSMKIADAEIRSAQENGKRVEL